MAIELLTPGRLIAFFDELTQDNKDSFVTMLASRNPILVLGRLLDAMSHHDRLKISERLMVEMNLRASAMLWPYFRDRIRERPELLDKEWDDEMTKFAESRFNEMWGTVRETEQVKFKESRDPKPRDSTIIRSNKILDELDKGSKPQAVANRNKVTLQEVSRVKKKRSYWRDWKAKLQTSKPKKQTR